MEQADLLKRTIEVLETLRIDYMLVGSVASSAYGEPRLTQDIDVVVDLRADQVARLCAAFCAPEYYVSPDAAAEAVRQGGQFNIIHPSSGNKIDLILARKDRWGREQFRRRQRAWILPDREGYIARPEDVILSKMEYYREGGSEKHLRDITGILKISPDQVDRDYVGLWAGRLGLTDIWKALLHRLGQAPPP